MFGLKPTGIIDKKSYDTFLTLRWVDDAVQEQGSEGLPVCE
jgi:hypothetical protein